MVFPRYHVLVLGLINNLCRCARPEKRYYSGKGHIFTMQLIADFFQTPFTFGPLGSLRQQAVALLKRRQASAL
ncbi:MAG: hypothetical protein ACUVQH_13350, partial [Thermogutta sp.]